MLLAPLVCPVPLLPHLALAVYSVEVRLRRRMVGL